MDPARIATGIGYAAYQRHRPEDTLLYQLVQRYYPELERLLASQSMPLPGYATWEFEDYFKVWVPGTRLSAGARFVVSPREVGRLQLQASWFLSQLRRKKDGGQCRPAGG